MAVSQGRHPKLRSAALAKRVGMCRAKVALSRKLAVIMHRIWVDQTDCEEGVVPDVA